MDFNLPDLEVDVLKCRENELFHWLNHLNATVAFIAKDYASKRHTNNEDITRIDKELQKLQGHIDQLNPLVDHNAQLVNDMRVLSELNSKSYTKLREENEGLRGEIATLRQANGVQDATITNLSEQLQQAITRIETLEGK